MVLSVFLRFCSGEVLNSLALVCSLFQFQVPWVGALYIANTAGECLFVLRPQLALEFLPSNFRTVFLLSSPPTPKKERSFLSLILRQI